MWPELPINGIALGQILSLLVTCTSSISTELALRGASIPFTQGAIQYALLFLAFSGPLRLFWWRWKESAWKYMLVSGIDVLSTGCIVKAFSLTSVTSVTLLDSWTIPCVILLTAVFFRQRYEPIEVVSSGKSEVRAYDTDNPDLLADIQLDRSCPLVLLCQGWLYCSSSMIQMRAVHLEGPPL